LRISVESDLEIKIQEPKKKAEALDYKDLGFRNETTTAWTTFLEFLKDPSHTYNIGPASISSAGIKKRVLSYDSKRKLLEEINKKLIAFFNKNYPVRIAEDFKVYERCRAERAGTYRFKFRVVDVEPVGDGKKSRTLEKLQSLMEEYKRSDTEQQKRIMAEITPLAADALTNEWVTREEIEYMLRPNEEIKYDPFENEEDVEQKY